MTSRVFHIQHSFTWLSIPCQILRKNVICHSYRRAVEHFDLAFYTFPFAPLSVSEALPSTVMFFAANQATYIEKFQVRQAVCARLTGRPVAYPCWLRLCRSSSNKEFLDESCSFSFWSSANCFCSAFRVPSNCWSTVLKRSELLAVKELWPRCNHDSVLWHSTLLKDTGAIPRV